MIDAGDADVWPFVVGKNSVESQRNAVSWGTVDRPMTRVELPDSQWTSEGQAMRSAAHFRCGRHYIDVTNRLQGFFKFDQPVGMDAVVVRKQNAGHTSKLMQRLAHSSFGGSLTQ